MTTLLSSVHLFTVCSLGKAHGTKSKLELAFDLGQYAGRLLLLPEPAAEYVAEMLESKRKCVPGLLINYKCLNVTYEM